MVFSKSYYMQTAHCYLLSSRTLRTRQSSLAAAAGTGCWWLATHDGRLMTDGWWLMTGLATHGGWLMTDRWWLMTDGW